MTTIIHVPEEICPPYVGIQDFLPYTPCKNTHTTLHVAAHIKHMLDHYGPEGEAAIKLPPATVLADFYQCPIKNVLDALHILHQQYYRYRLCALDTEITLYDPLNRRKFQQPIQKAG
jgi:hypothetical protein